MKTSQMLNAKKKDAVFQASIEFIGDLTGMNPPPIETAPPETFAPFRAFTERVCEIFTTPQESPAWMPIESAPTGAMILLANMNAMEARAWCFVGWMVDGRVCGHRMDKPTHWMPLPKAPGATP